MGSSGGEEPTGVEYKASVVEHVIGNGDLDDLTEQVFLDFVVGDIGAVLATNQHGVHTYWNNVVLIALILNSDLHLGVGAHPWDDAFPTALLQPKNELGTVVMSERHAVFSLVGGVSNHQSLVTGSHILILLPNVNALGYFRTLLVHGDDDGGCLVVHSDSIGSVADLLYGLPGYLLKVHLPINQYLPKYHANGVLYGAFAGYFSLRIFLEACV